MGYSIVHIVKGKVQPVVLDVLKFNAKLDHYTRLSHIFEELSKVVELYKPDEMALEASLGKNVQSMLKLGRAQGVCMATALSKKIPVFEYSPRLIKQSIVGNGNASKEQVSKWNAPEYVSWCEPQILRCFGCTRSSSVSSCTD